MEGKRDSHQDSWCDEHSLLETSGSLQPPVTSEQLGTGASTSRVCSPGCLCTQGHWHSSNQIASYDFWSSEGNNEGEHWLITVVLGFFPNPLKKKTCWRWLEEGVFERGESSGDVSSYHHGNWTFLVTMESSSLSCWVAWGAGASRAGAHEGIQLTTTIASGFPRK